MTLAYAEEMVVLCDAADRAIGVVPKSVVHADNTPLHRAFSCFLFDDRDRLLVTQRSLVKKTWPGIWSNSFCGHPGPGETREAALRRRGRYELGCEVADIVMVSEYTYRFERDGIVEHEVCPVFMARIASTLRPNPDEVGEFEWLTWLAFEQALATDEPEKWSEWCREETLLVAAYREQTT